MPISMRMPMEIFMLLQMDDEGYTSRGTCRGKSYGKRCGRASQIDEVKMLTNWIGRWVVEEREPQWKGLNFHCGHVGCIR